MKRILVVAYNKTIGACSSCHSSFKAALVMDKPLQ